MKTETEQNETEAPEQTEQSVCGCWFGCLDMDSHNSINGGNSIFPDSE